MKKSIEYSNNSIINPSEEEKTSAKERSQSDRIINTIAKILCFLAAFAIWLYAVDNDSTTITREFTSIPVRILGTNELANEELSIVSSTNNYINITVSGKKNIINKLTVEDIDAYVSLSGITEANEYVLDIIATPPSGVSIDFLSQQKLSVYVDRSESRKFTIEPKMTEYALPNDYSLGDAILNYSEVTISGPKEALDQIASVQAIVSLGTLKESQQYFGIPLTLLDAYGNVLTNTYLKLSIQEVTMRVPIYLIKEVSLSTSFKQTNSTFTDNISVKISPETIFVKGEPKLVEALDHIELAVLDLKDPKNEDDSYIIDKKTIIPPDGIEIIDVNKEATISVTHNNTKIKPLSISTIQVENPNNLKFDIQTNVLDVNIRCQDYYYNYLNPNVISATINLNYSPETTGTFEVPVNIAINGIYTSYAYEVGTYSVTVTIG